MHTMMGILTFKSRASTVFRGHGNITPGAGAVHVSRFDFLHSSVLNARLGAEVDIAGLICRLEGKYPQTRCHNLLTLETIQTSIGTHESVHHYGACFILGFYKLCNHTFVLTFFW